MKCKYLLTLLIIFCASLASASNIELGDILAANKKILWTLRPEQCEIVFKVRIRPQDNYNNVMRYNSKDSQKDIIFEKQTVPEILFYFAKRKLQSITISIYNRGDNGVIDEKSFSALSDKLEKFITGFSADSKPENEIRRFAKFHIESKVWQDDACDYVLRKNLKGKYPEYLQLVIYPAGKAKNLKTALKTTAGKNQLQLNLNIQENGDRYIDIPMVNQGSKGYCVGATTERIMKYYGSRIDQHIIAQLAESDAYRGTDIKKIIEVLEKNKSRLDIRTEKVFTDDILSFEDLQKLTQIYNNFAKKQKRSRVRFNDFCTRKGRYRYVHFRPLIANYEYDLFREARCRNKREMKKFSDEIYQSLNEGIPLVWATFTFQNMSEGRAIGSFGFHVRIINGFNQKTNQIIYTDSWGPGHEKKYMPMDDARAITLMLIQITPR